MSTSLPQPSSPSVFVAETSIAWPEQEEFIRFSGDRNPLHTDPLTARRMPPGDIVVYGMHMLCWALDALAAGGHIDRELGRLQLKFVKWIYLGDVASLWFRKGTGTAADRLEIRVGQMLAMTCTLARRDALEEAPALAANTSTAPSTKRMEPRALMLEELEGVGGATSTAESLEASRSLFPALASIFGPELAAEIGACSYVVGMEAPGLYSVDSSAEMNLRPSVAAERPASLHFQVVSLDQRFRRAHTQVAGQALYGTLEAFVRNLPARQPGMEDVAKHVVAGEFAGVRALVVGGSRGLGEVAAKCIAAGGGQCTLTFASGEQDAANVAAQIQAAGSSASTARYNARQAAAPQLAAMAGPFTHVLYFATGPISRPKAPGFSAAHFADFNAIYLQGFHDLCAELLRAGSGLVESGKPLTAFYPSSVFLDEYSVGFLEYAASKAAGEQLCRDLQRASPNLRIVTARLPRLLTDQTATMAPVKYPDTVAALLPLLRQL